MGSSHRHFLQPRSACVTSRSVGPRAMGCQHARRATPGPTVMDVLAAVSTRSSTAPTRPPMSCWLANADTSDAPAQPVADTVIDHGAEALGALTDFLTEISRELLATASAPATFHIAKSRYSSTDGSCAGPRPRRERGRGPHPRRPCLMLAERRA